MYPQQAFGAYPQQSFGAYPPQQQQQQNYTPFGMYGYNPDYTLAETPYARMTGQFTTLNNSQVQNLSSFLQPTFVDMNPYLGNSGIPCYPSFIGGAAMMNPDVPLMQPNQAQGYQQQYQNYPPQWMPQQQQPQQMYMQPQPQPQQMYMQPQPQQQQMYMQPQQPSQQMFMSQSQQTFITQQSQPQPKPQQTIMGLLEQMDQMLDSMNKMFG